MTVKLTSNFFANARGITFKDGGNVTWSLNAATNELSATASSSGGTVTSIGSTNLTIGGTSSVPTVNLSSAQVTNIAAGGTALQTAAVVDSITGAGTVASPLQLSGDAATPGNSFFYGTNSSGVKGWYASLASGAATASVGLAAVAGSGTAYMLANAAPALNVGISPTWTGNHTFTPGSGVALTLNGTAASQIGIFAGSAGNTYFDLKRVTTLIGRWGSADSIAAAGASTDFGLAAPAGNLIFAAGGSSTIRMTINGSTGSVLCAGPLGWNGAAPPAQVTGFGTPVGGAVVANYNITDAGGANSNTNKCVAEILAILKAHGMIGA